MIRFYYHESPDEGGGGLVEFTDRVNLAERNVHVTTNAEQNSVGTNTIVVDDPDGDWATSGHRKVLILEDDAPAENQLIFWGYTAERTLRRIEGGEATEAARQWTITLTDINTIVARKVMAGNDSDRPAETDVARIQWLLSTGEVADWGDVTTYVSTTDPVDMDAADYNGQQVSSVIDDCAQQSGKNAYMRWIWDTSEYVSAFWYGADDVNLAQSSLRISNVLDDIDEVTTWAPSDDSTLSRDPSRIYSGVFGNYDGGWTYRTRGATITDFANRDTVASWPNVKTAARAQARADRYLADLATEEDAIRTAILVPPASVNDAHAGDEIEVRFSHFPDYESFSAVRILERTVTFVTPEVYQIDYVVSGPGGSSTNVGETHDGYLCTPTGYQVPEESSGLNVPMRVNFYGAINPSGGTGDSFTDFGEYCVLYGQATYSVHTYDTSFIGAQPLTPMFSNITNSAIYHGDLGSTDCNFVPSKTAHCPPLTERTDLMVFPGTSGIPADAIARMSYLGWSGHSPHGSSWYVVLSYVSGPDPRFEDLPGCPLPS